MLIKVVLVFLGAMAILGMVGNLFYPGALRRTVKGHLARHLADRLPATCQRCGRVVFGKSGCNCKKG